MDTLLSGDKVPELAPYVGLLLGHHFVRIAYEGAIAIRSANPCMGIPELAALLSGRFAQLTERARHLTKMLDNTKKTYADLLSEFAAELKVHHDALTGNAVRLARWLETDLGLFYVDGALVGATVPIAYRLGLYPADPATMRGADLNAITMEWGGTLAVLGAATFNDSEPEATLDLAGIRVTSRDRRADRYLASRFDPQFPLELKMLILMIEGDLNTASLILPRTARRHQSAEFRARTVTAYHCLSALKRISDQHPGLSTSGLDGLRALLAEAAAQRLLSPTGEKVRNRSVRAALDGAREPLAELIRRHWPTAVFLAARLLGSTELARDAAQEAAVAALTDLDQLRSPDRFGAWFCGIALNVARRWRRQLRLELPGPPPDRASPAPDPAEAAELAEVAARVRGAVAALPDGQRDAVWLFYLLGLTHREVAAELGISVNAVKARLHQARASLAPGLAPIAGIEHVEAAMTQAAEWIDVSVSGIRMSQDGEEWQRTYVMVLAERRGDRELPIWIGPAEAIVMAMSLESAETPRPFTHKLAASLVGAAGARITEVRITRLADEVFYALVIVDGPAGRQEVDARPSDAVNLALATGAAIRVEAGLFAAALIEQRAGELASLPVATAKIVVEAQRCVRERRQCSPRPGEPPGQQRGAGA